MEKRTTQQNQGHPELPVGDTVHFLVSLAQRYGHDNKVQDGEEFIKKLRLVVDAFGRALYESEDSVSFREAAEFSQMARAHRRPSTVADLRSYIRRMCRDTELAQKSIRQVTISDCRAMLYKEFGHSLHSYRKAQSVLHSIFSYAMRQRWCEYNPAKAILRPPVIEQRIEILDIAQIQALVRCTRTIGVLQPMSAALRLMLWCGVRPTEVRRLHWGDIDKVEKVVYIEGMNSKTGGARAVPLRGGALCLLDEQYPDDALIAPKDWNRLWKRLRVSAGIVDWQNDALRHTFASMHLKRYHNLLLLQEEMGHRNSSLLQTRYLNLRHLRRSAAIRFFAADYWN